ncbi:MAG: tRNA (adenosine(37)-N6)-threonylcarbamoyltransferase complex ATPase subunit type 1 TsaE [Desulfomonilaceae bacterium]
MTTIRSHKFFSFCEADTIAMGEAIGSLIRQGDLVTLIGPMGAGKTRIAKGIVSAATGIDHNEVISPSFSLINRYDGPITVDHADLYRLDPDQALELGVYEALEDGAVVMEWGEHKDKLGDSELQIVITYSEDENSRLIELTYAGNGSWGERIDLVLGNM